MALQAGAVVAGYDGSQASRQAVRWAAREATTRGRPLLVVHAFAIPLDELTRVHLPGESFTLKALRDQAEQAVEGVAAECRELFPGLEVDVEVHLGHAATVLVDLAVDAGVLVLGPPAHSRLQRVLLGSTAAEVVRTAHVPVVVVRGERAAQQQVRRVVVGVDGSPSSTRAVGFAYDFAARHGADLIAMLSYSEARPDPLKPNRGWQFDSDTVDACRRELSEAVAGWSQTSPDVVVREVVD